MPHDHEACATCDHPLFWHLYPVQLADGQEHPPSERVCNVEGCGCISFASVVDVLVIDRRTGEPLAMPDPEPEPEPVEGEVVDEPVRAVVPYAPSAGESIDLADTPRVAATIRELVDWQEMVLQPLLAELQGAMIREADRQGQYTLRYGRLTVTVDGPDVAKYVWQDDLSGMIVDLLAAGMPAERAEMMASEVTSWKAHPKEINRAAKVEKYRVIIDRYRTRVPRKRSVKAVGNPVDRSVGNR